MTEHKNKEHFFDLPESWSWTTTREVCSSVRDGTHDTPKYVEQGIPLITSKNLNEDQIDFLTAKLISFEDHNQISIRSRVENGDVLFAMIGTIGNPIVVETTREFSIKNIGLFKKNEAVIRSKYLKYWLSSYPFGRILEQQALVKGTTQKFVPLGNLRALPVPLPPLKEQRRVVDKIEALKARSQQVKEALEAIPPLLDQFRQSVLAAAFRGDLTANWRSQNPDVEPALVLLERIRAERKKLYREECKKAEAEGRRKPTSFKENIEPIELSRLPVIPNTWCYEKLVNLSNILGGVTKGRKLGNRATIMLPYLRVANVQDGFLDLTEIKEIEALPEDLEKYHLEYGDLLFTEGGDRDKLGRGTVWRNDRENCIHQNHVYRSRLYNSGIVCDYISFATKSDYAKAYFFEKASQTTNLASINITSLGNVPLAIPPKEEQKEIVYRVQTFFKAADNISQQYREAKAYLDQLEQSILAKAFRGELVPQDPNDEPASVLLERIQAEREKREAEAKTSKKSTGKTTGQRSRKAKQQDLESIQLGFPGLE